MAGVALLYVSRYILSDTDNSTLRDEVICSRPIVNKRAVDYVSNLKHVKIDLKLVNSRQCLKVFLLTTQIILIR